MDNTERCGKCGEWKVVGSPCVGCWNREVRDYQAKRCCVEAPCGDPCTPGYSFEHRSYDSGWVCPKCGNVYGPMQMECWNCNQSHKVTCEC